MWRHGIRFEILELLGEGAQGTVFKALRRDYASGLRETVALKVLHSETAVELWKQEFESLRKVRSPHCVQVLSFDRFKGSPALVLEFVDGVTLLQLGRSGVLNDSDIDEILRQIERALVDLHSCGLFHGDLSPANVLVDRDGFVKVFDFGLANCGGPEARLTPEFASPERLNGASPDFAADLFSLGKVESFLRGRKILQSNYLHYEPCARKPRAEEPQANSRAQLATKVQLWLARKNWRDKFRTKTLQHVIRRSSPIKALAVFICLTFCALTSSTALPKFLERPTLATLMVRTLKWHRIEVDSVELGYAPVNLTLDASKPVTISWTNSNGSGRKLLRLQPGQRMLMDDHDFTAPGGVNGTSNRTSQNSRNPRR